MQEIINGLLYDTDNAEVVLKSVDHIGITTTFYKANNGDFFIKTSSGGGYESLTPEYLVVLTKDTSDYIQVKNISPKYENDLIYHWLISRGRCRDIQKHYPQFNNKNCQVVYRKDKEMLCKNKFGELFEYHKGSFWNTTSLHIGPALKINNSEEYDAYIFRYIEKFSLKDAEKRFPKLAYKRA